MKTLEDELNKYFGYASFRTGQKQIIQDVLNGNDVLGILPTGTGKSICYQLPARMLSGTVIVVSPLISLMIDQVKQLKATGFTDVVAINSFLDPSQKQQVYNNFSAYKLIYISPEMLQNKVLLKRLSTIHISLFVVDEAHCISQWGHEFRPDYLKLDQVIKLLQSPTVLALSATATAQVQDDIIEQLNCPTMVKHIYPIDKDNLTFSIKRFDHFTEKLDYVAKVLTEHPVSTMVYFSSRDLTESSSEFLANKLPNLKVAYYHGGMEQTDRIMIQQQFMNDQLDVICCTSAFGMGINKENIRLVVHFHLPTQMESFIQEVGRAGRDGLSSVSLVLLAPHDDILPMSLIKSELPNEEQVNQVIHYFTTIDKHKPIDRAEVMNTFGLNETQWRFLNYQLENSGMIEDVHVEKSQHDWDKLRRRIIHLIHKRTHYKQNKLNELLDWSNKVNCRREELYASFQHSVKQPKYDCCDICGFTFSTWNPLIKESRQTSEIIWEEKLKAIMLQGDKDA